MLALVVDFEAYIDLLQYFVEFICVFLLVLNSIVAKAKSFMIDVLCNELRDPLSIDIPQLKEIMSSSRNRVLCD